MDSTLTTRGDERDLIDLVKQVIKKYDADPVSIFGSLKALSIWLRERLTVSQHEELIAWWSEDESLYSVLKIKESTPLDILDSVSDLADWVFEGLSTEEQEEFAKQYNELMKHDE